MRHLQDDNVLELKLSIMQLNNGLFSFTDRQS